MKPIFSILTSSVIACLLVVAAPASYAKTQPIYNVQHHATPMAAEKLTNKQIRERIMNAATMSGWNCRDSGKNRMICEIVVRQRHQAVVEIYYDQKGFSIHNVSSKNLHYKNGKIHRNYNRWVKKLEVNIAKALNSSY